MKRNTPYAYELASADLGGQRIERILVKATWQQTIRFGKWMPGRFQTRPLEIPEDELIILVADAMAAGVFTRGFIDDLRAVLDAQIDGHL